MSWKDIRDGLLFFAGLGGVIHEAFFTSLDRADLLIVFATMMGIPAFFFGYRNGHKAPGETTAAEKDEIDAEAR